MSQEVLMKQIRIKTGVVKRITREKQSYEKETENEQKRLLKFKDNGDDIHVLRKQEEVILESSMMITDCQKRLKTAHADLKSILEKEIELAENEEVKTAWEILSLAEPHM